MMEGEISECGSEKGKRIVRGKYQMESGKTETNSGRYQPSSDLTNFTLQCMNVACTAQYTPRRHVD